MESSRKVTYHTKTKWSNDEDKIFALYFPIFKTNFNQYTKVLNRTYSQIKSHYHNKMRNCDFLLSDEKID